MRFIASSVFCRQSKGARHKKTKKELKGRLVLTQAAQPTLDAHKGLSRFELDFGEHDMERAAAIVACAFDPNASLVARDNFLAKCQANADA
jgi:hypothetical protein